MNLITVPTNSRNDEKITSIFFLSIFFDFMWFSKILTKDGIPCFHGESSRIMVFTDMSLKECVLVSARSVFIWFEYCFMEGQNRYVQTQTGTVMRFMGSVVLSLFCKLMCCERGSVKKLFRDDSFYF